MAKTYWQNDPGHTRLQFRVRHMFIANISGYFREAYIRVSTDGDDFRTADIEVRVPVASITTGVEMRDGHLKSPEFFDLSEHPDIIFRANGMEHLGGDRFRLAGELTIRGITREQQVEVRYSGKVTDIMGNEKAGFSIEAALDRFAFNLQWNGLLTSGKAIVGGQIKVSAQIQMQKNLQLSGFGSFESQLRAASLTLQSQLPTVDKLRQTVRDGFLFHRAKDHQLGGDFFWFDKVKGKSVILIADSVGHGMEGSLKAMMGISLINTVMAVQEDIEPKAILISLHRALRQMIQNAQGMNPELLVLETGVVVVDEEKRHLAFSGTGISMFYQKDTLEVVRVQTPRIGLGSEKLNPAELEEHTYRYADGEAVYLFSDGFVDQLGGDQKRKLGSGRVADWLAATSFMDFNQVGEYLPSMFMRWLGNQEQIDDVTLIGAQL